MTPARICIFHDNLVQMGGAERVAQALLQALPGAELHTTLAARSQLPADLRDGKIHTSWMRYLPAPARLYRHYFMLYPLAIETANVDAFDLVVSSCWGYSKGVKRRSDALHVCYCHTPTRWVWRYHDYVAREKLGVLQKRVLPRLVNLARIWDTRASKRPDYFIANSTAVAERIRQSYGRVSVVIHPPIDVQRFRIGRNPGDYFLVVSRLVAYKRVDLAIEACNQLKRRLVIIGDGPDRRRLERLAGPTIEFRGRRPDAEVVTALTECRAVIFPGEEDFGMVPLEANASGRPVVAWRGGGALDTVCEGRTGVFFDQPTGDAVAGAILDLEQRTWDPCALRRHAEQFDLPEFIRRVREFLRRVAETPRLKATLHDFGN